MMMMMMMMMLSVVSSHQNNFGSVTNSESTLFRYPTPSTSSIYSPSRKIKETGGRERARKQLLDDLKERIGYCKLQDKALGSPVRRTSFRRACGPVVRDNITMVTY
jgi:hypothetical protein